MKTSDRPPSPPLSEQQRQERARAEEKKRLKRAANRRSACTSRVRKKQFVEEMTAANAQLQLYSEILARAPPTVTVDQNCRLRFASQAAKDLLGITSAEDVDLRSLLADGPDRPRQAQWLAQASGCEQKRDASPPSSSSSPRRDANWPPQEWSDVRHAVSNSSGDSGGSNSDRRGESSSNNGSSGGSHDGSDDDSKERVDTQVPRAPPPAKKYEEDTEMADASRSGSSTERGASPSNSDTNVNSNSSRDGSTQSDDEHPDLDVCRLELVCRDGRVVSVDAAKGGAFASNRAAPVVEDDRPRRGVRSPPTSPFARQPSSPSRPLARGESHDSLATATTVPPPPGPSDPRETVLSLRPAYEYDDASAWLGSLTVGQPTQAPPGAAATVRSAVSEAIRSARQPPRSPPRVEDLCADTNTSPAELQSVVDGLMLIAGAVPPSTS